MRNSLNFHINLNIWKFRFLALFYINRSSISHGSRIITSESEYVIKFFLLLKIFRLKGNSHRFLEAAQDDVINKSKDS